MSKVFFTADTHCGHSNIMKYCHRPGLTKEELSLLKEEEKWFALSKLPEEQLSSEEKNFLKLPQPYLKVSRQSVERMDNYLIDGINKTVGENDILYHLGDFCFYSKDSAYQTAAKYRYRINCQNVHFIFGNHDHRSIGNLFSSASDISEVRIGNQKIVLNHYAMVVWNKSHRGNWQLYGHSHSGLEQWMCKQMPGHKSMDVGVDNAVKILGEYRPFSFEEIEKIMLKRSGHVVDHHGARE